MAYYLPQLLTETVHKFPEEFFLRQAKSIEEFKKTGNY